MKNQNFNSANNSTTKNSAANMFANSATLLKEEKLAAGDHSSLNANVN